MALLLCGHPAWGAEAEVLVLGSKAQKLADSVVMFTPAGGKATLPKPAKVVVDQINKEFLQHVTPVLIGTPVYFPNKDDIRHHVYSFSDAKEFELPLYKGTPAAPVVFDKPGVVKLGCNIHDWMLGYIYVVETPYYALTDARGEAHLANLPGGSYVVTVWHPDMRDDVSATARTVTVKGGQNNRLVYTLETRKAFRLRREPPGEASNY